MKTTNKVLAVLLAVTMLICVNGITATAAENAAASPGAKTTGTATIFDGYRLTVLDKTVPATDMRGRINDRTVMCFVSADDRELGVLLYSDYRAIIDKHKTLIRYADGSSLAVPPGGYEDWHDWFADEFNRLHSRATVSREEAVAAHISETIEEYRQELIRLVNIEREDAGLPAYIINDKCMQYSQLKASELPALFSHTRPDGTNAGYEIISAKSNTPAGVVKAWMESKGHRAAILNADRSYVGAGCYITSTGGTFWQMMFALDPEHHVNSFLNTTSIK